MTYPGTGGMLGTINEPGRDLDSRLNGGVGPMYDRRTSAQNSVTGYNNPAYDDDYTQRNNARNSIAGNYGADNRRSSNIRRVADDDYNPSYDEGMDFIAMGASMGQGDGGSAPTGRLPPLQDQEQPTKRKKKKKGLLKRHRQLAEDDEL